MDLTCIKLGQYFVGVFQTTSARKTDVSNGDNINKVFFTQHYGNTRTSACNHLKGFTEVTVKRVCLKMASVRKETRRNNNYSILQ